MNNPRFEAPECISRLSIDFSCNFISKIGIYFPQFFMKRLILFKTVGVVFAVTFTLQAQPSRGGERGPGGMRPNIPVMAALDENKDGIISIEKYRTPRKP
ncbi:MAG: hypothetical protein Ct9H300mP7_4120 [Verrucomicrobiota bacterium]|nr:MAG: hypothetical protein Ct9H300mP7_4120 [Verrucomicrobiota bacterium]